MFQAYQFKYLIRFYDHNSASFSTTKDIEATNFKGLKMRINQLYYSDSKGSKWISPLQN